MLNKADIINEISSALEDLTGFAPGGDYYDSDRVEDLVEKLYSLGANDLNEFQNACKATDGTTLDLSFAKGVLNDKVEELVELQEDNPLDERDEDLAEVESAITKLEEVEKLFKLGYLALGLVGEAGEVAEKLKKLMRLNQLPTKEQKTAIALEVGDVLWYASVLLDYLGMDLETCCNALIQKLQSRKERGVIKGEGDNR